MSAGRRVPDGRAQKILGRRGLSAWGLVAGSVSTIAIAIVIFAIANGAIFGTTKTYTEKQCQLSLLAQTATELRPVSSMACVKATTDVIALKCNQNTALVTGGKVYRNGEDVTNKYDPRCPTGEASCLQQNVMAREMQMCWGQFFRGEKLVFQKHDTGFWGWTGAGKNLRVCYVCGDVTTDAPISSFTTYLQQKNLSDAPKSFYDYLNNSNAYCSREYATGSGCFANYAQQHDPKIPQDQFGPGTYAVTFIRKRFDECKPTTKTESDAPALTVQVLPVKDLKKYCDRVVI